MIALRDYQSADAPKIAALFTATVHRVCAADYSPAQLEAWAPRPPDLARWQARLDAKRPRVAVRGGAIIGFAELDPDGHIDCFYVHAEHQGRGVGGLLLRDIEARARTLGLPRLHAEVSHTARPFFARAGFALRGENRVERRGIALSNWLMDKDISSPATGNSGAGDAVL